MNTKEKIKRTLFIAAGFALATYLIMSGMAILKTEAPSKVEQNATNNLK